MEKRGSLPGGELRNRVSPRCGKSIGSFRGTASTIDEAQEHIEIAMEARGSMPLVLQKNSGTIILRNHSP
jgi:hypothetical protein